MMVRSRKELGLSAGLTISSPETGESAKARRFQQARSARSAAILEDYTELIAELTRELGEARTTDIAHRLGVTLPTATKTLGRLKREGLVTSRPYRGVYLTEAGALMAEQVRARHRLVVDVLLAVGVPEDAAEADAEGIEHYISRATLDAFARFVERARRLGSPESRLARKAE